MVTKRHLRAIVVLALLPSAVAAGQTAPDAVKEKTTGRVTLVFAQKLVDQWTTAVRTHVAGTIDEPVKTIASWPSERFTLVLRLVSRTPDAARTLMFGLSLHTDIAIAERYRPIDRPDAVVLVDGQVTHYIGRSAHWQIARQIAADLAARPGEGPRVAAWYRATAALMQEWRALDLLGMHLEAGQTLFVDDPVLALYQGTLRQVFGDPRLYDYLRKRGSTEGLGSPPLASRHGATGSSSDGLGPVPSAHATRVELGVARRELRRAVRLDPTLHEARIRLAHVLSRLGDDREAVEVVRPALEAPLAPFSEFYAALILGRSEEQLGRFDEAGVAYARAAARFPGAPSAEIGRSRVALAQGRAPDALKILVDVVGPDATEQSDPWLSYWQHDPDADTLLEAWRAGLK
jgi:tetratricopeptide (TPR) repeat protein